MMKGKSSCRRGLSAISRCKKGLASGKAGAGFTVALMCSGHASIELGKTRWVGLSARDPLECDSSKHLTCQCLLAELCFHVGGDVCRLGWQRGLVAENRCPVVLRAASREQRNSSSKRSTPPDHDPPSKSTPTNRMGYGHPTEAPPFAADTLADRSHHASIGRLRVNRC